MRNTLRFLGCCALVAMLLICIIRLGYDTKQQTDIKQTNLIPVQTLNNPEPILENTPQIVENAENIESITVEKTEENNFTEETNITLIKETSLAELKNLGWRFPKKADYDPYIYPQIKKYAKNEIKADFNGDGKIDKAILLVRDNENAVESKESSVFIFLSQNKTSPTIYQSSEGEGLVYYSLSLQPVELIERVWFSITLTNPAIAVSPFEGSGGEIIFWDNDKNKFSNFYSSC
ncbi:MAG: hypothetical protein WAQ98_20895 [Blastocatellia bacterium]